MTSCWHGLACLLSAGTLVAAVLGCLWGDWLWAQKLVTFEDSAGASIEIATDFHFAPLRTRQIIVTELGQQIYYEDAYRWCRGTARGMPPSVQAELCKGSRYVNGFSLALLGVSVITALAAFTSSAKTRRALHQSFLGLSSLAAMQASVALGLLYMWSTLGSALEEFFSTEYPETNDLQLQAGPGMFLAMLSFVSAALIVVCSAVLICCVGPSAEADK